MSLALKNIIAILPLLVPANIKCPMPYLPHRYETQE